MKQGPECWTKFYWKILPEISQEGWRRKLHVSNIAGVKIGSLCDGLWMGETDHCRCRMLSVKSRWPVSSIERRTEVATAITTIASTTIAGTIAVTQATKTTKAITKATILVAVVVAHCDRARGLGWMLKMTFLRVNITCCPQTFVLPPCGCGQPQHTSVILFENPSLVKNSTIKS